MNLLVVGSTWIHTGAVVVLLGWYAALSLVVLPGLTAGGVADPGRVVHALERRALPWIIASVVLFMVTGLILMFASPKYAGLGAASASPWTTLILVKHVVVVAMVVLGGILDQLLIPRAATVPGGLRPVARAAAGMGLLGALVLLLTAAAQAG